MGGMGGMTEAVGQLLAAAGITLPPWAVPAFALALMVLLLPRLLRNMRTGQARKLLGRSRVAEGAEREAIEAQALALVAGHGPGLLGVAEEALRINRKPLARAAIAQLAQLPDLGPGLKRELRRLHAALQDDPLAKAPTPEAVVILVEQLVENGMVAEAERKLAHARKRWPAAIQLDEAAATIDRAASA